MTDDILKIVGMIVVIGFIIFLAVKSMKLQGQVMEGLTNATPSLINGEAGNAAAYVSAIKAQVTHLQDSLLIPKYRTDYENIIMSMDDYINVMMLQSVLNLNTTTDTAATNIDTLTNLNTLYSSKVALNATMKFLDST